MIDYEANSWNAKASGGLEVKEWKLARQGYPL